MRTLMRHREKLDGSATPKTEVDEFERSLFPQLFISPARRAF